MKRLTAYFQLDVPVDGGLGPGTELASDATQEGWPNLLALEYMFETWSGCHIVTTYPCFIISEHLLKLVISSELSGWTVADLSVRFSPQFIETSWGTTLPKFYWFKPTGRMRSLARTINIDESECSSVSNKATDFALGPKAELLVTQKAVDSLDLNLLRGCSVKVFPFCMQ